MSISSVAGLTGVFGWITVNRPRETVPTNLETVMGHGMTMDWLATPKLFEYRYGRLERCRVNCTERKEKMGQPEVTSELVDYPANGRHPIPSKQLGSGLYWVANMIVLDLYTHQPSSILRCFGYDRGILMPES